MKIEERFANKIALVTGGATGIGKGIACRLGSEGASIILFDINKEFLDDTIAELNGKNIIAKGYEVDVSNEEQVAGAIKEVEQNFFSIDILVNAAGIVGPTSTSITEYTAAAFDELYQVNLKGSFLITKYVLQVMKQKGQGRVLLISSMAGKDGNPGMVGYTTSKAGVIGLVKGVAKEFAETGITINGLAPAVIKTEMNDKTSPEQMAYMTAKIPMKRLGTIEEVAAISCFIVSDENSFTTGFIYDISGGRATY